MKKTLVKLIAFTMCTVILLLTLSSCSKDPYEYDLDEFITVPSDFSGIVITEEQILQAVSEQIQSARESKAVNEPVTLRGADSGDTVIISLKCYKNDENRTLIPEISDDSCTLALGQGKYPAELENALVGKIPGERFTVLATLPSTFTALELAGKQIVYECEIKQIFTAVLPEYNGEFVNNVFGFETVAEYEKYLYARVKEELVFEQLLAMSTVTHYPVAEVQSYTTSFIKYHTEKADELKITLEEYASKKFFVSITDFHLKADAYAKELVKKEMVLYSLARKNNLSLTDEEYTEGAMVYVKQYGLESVSQLESRFGTAYVQQTVLMDKVLWYLSEQVTVSTELAP